MPEKKHSHYPKQWRHRRRGEHWTEHGPEWKRKRPRFLFFRFATMFGLIALLVAGGMGAFAFLLTHLFRGDGRTAVLVWASGCGLAFALPILAMAMAMRAWRSIATPLADVMAAADAVADGDLSVRVSEQRPGEFGGLARSFNRMAGELERAEQQRRNLTADVAHELRTPLHIIQGNLEGLLDNVYEPTAEHIEGTLEETRLLARLVDDLRTLSLAEAGQLPLILEPVDIVELLHDVQTSFSGQAETAVIKLRVRIEGEQKIPPIIADADRLDQILSNLVANALRYTESGGTIRLSASQEADMVRIEVQDSGKGIEPDALPFIFDRFWRGDSARAHADGVGSGLGLAIAKQLLLAHNGRINVHSTLNIGTTFVIELPLS